MVGKKAKGSGKTKIKEANTSLLDEIVPDKGDSSSAIIDPIGNPAQQEVTTTNPASVVETTEAKPTPLETDNTTLPLPAVVEIPPPPRDEL